MQIVIYMKQIINFLRKLQANNNREWFMEHKDEYKSAQARFNEIVDQIIYGICQFDPSLTGISHKDCTYRIYRDVRFSKDKSPYKTHFGAFMCPKGKKSGFAGYYLHVGTGLGEGYPFQHMLATGDYCYDKKVLQILREDICYGNGEFERILDGCPAFQLDKEQMLSRVPNGFPRDSKYSEYLRLKSLCLLNTPSNDFMLSDDVVNQTVDLFRTTKPFLDFINRAIQYNKEM